MGEVDATFADEDTRTADEPSCLSPRSAAERTAAGFAVVFAFAPTPAAAGALDDLMDALMDQGHFPNEEAARKLIHLAITNAVPAWTKTRSWIAARLAFKIHY